MYISCVHFVYNTNMNIQSSTFYSGDGAPALTQLSFQSAVSEDVAKEIVSLYVKAGANLNVRASKMYASETPICCCHL